MTKKREMAGSNSSRELSSRDSTLMENHTEEANSFGPMGSFMTVNGSMVSKMAKVFGKELEGTLILENGKLARLTVGVSISGRTVTDMKATFRTVSRTEKVESTLQMGTFTRGTTVTVGLMGTESTSGKMALLSKVISLKD
jgi:hypothetical protein